MADNLPRLLYLGDVPVESSYHGSALLYRLLENFPLERLLVAEASAPSKTERRLPHVRYTRLNLVNNGLLRSRFHRLYANWLTVRAGARATRVAGELGEFRPEAILTVAHGFGWLTAAAIARRQNIPLHLVVHDDWPMMAPVSPRMRSRLR